MKLVAALLIGFLVGAILIRLDVIECEAKNGVYVRGVFGYICINAERIP